MIGLVQTCLDYYDLPMGGVAGARRVLGSGAGGDRLGHDEDKVWFVIFLMQEWRVFIQIAELTNHGLLHRIIRFGRSI